MTDTSAPSRASDMTGDHGPVASAHLHTLFLEHPLLERPRLAASHGFTAVDLWWPFDGPDPDDAEVDALAHALADAGVQVVSMNADSGDLPGGDRGFACDPAEQDRFRRAVASGIDVAVRLGGPRLNVLYGNRPAEGSLEEQDALAHEQLAAATAGAADRGVQVVLEALNDRDTPRYPINTTAQAMAVIEALAPQVQLGFLYDQYHLSVMGEDLGAALDRAGDSVHHVQIADVPGRHEPGTGTVDFPAFFALLEARGYRGAVGLEYFPLGATETSFGWLDGQLRR